MRNQDQNLTPSSNRPGAIGAIYENAVLSWKLFWDNRVSFFSKLIPIGTLIYLFSPLDFDWLIPVVGYLDDVGLLILGMSVFIKLAPPDVVQEYRRLMGSNLPETETYSPDDVIDGEVEIIDN